MTELGVDSEAANSSHDACNRPTPLIDHRDRVRDELSSGPIPFPLQSRILVLCTDAFMTYGITGD